VLLLWNFFLALAWWLIYFYTPFRGTVGARQGRFELGAYDPAAAGLKVLVNAVSAGEVVAIAPFIRELVRRVPGVQVAVLTTTASGQTMARDKLGDVVRLIAYFPLLDLSWVVRRYLDRLRPDIYVTTEAELWPNIQSQSRARGIPVALVNARLYLHNKHGLRGAIVRRLYGLCDLIVCQDERQRANFLQFGIAADRLAVSGNTKFDFELPEWGAARLASERERFGLVEGSGGVTPPSFVKTSSGGGTPPLPVITAGSTHEGEDELVLAALTELRPRWPQLRLVIAPRHIERAAAVVQLAGQAGFRALRLSEQQPGVAWDVLVIDSYGVLTDFYRLADLVVLGGSFSPKVGGHNILEATALGKPVLVGPCTFGITSQLELLQGVGGMVEVPAGAALAQAAAGLLADAARATAIGAAAQAATLANRGSAKRAVDRVLALHEGRSSGI
jgi:3-deoxy-D-manno-octulosonic-acid transferase